MLTLELIEMTQEKAIYGYHPEDKDEHGILSVNRHTGEVDVVKIAESDRHKRYLSHAISKIAQLSHSGTYEKKVTVAWC